MSEADRLIEQLGLLPHPEGGHYRESFRDASGEGGRAHSTAIYFLLKAGEVSKWHRIDGAEVWHWYARSTLEILTAHTLTATRELAMLGPHISQGERPQIVVPGNVWQSARSLGAYTLVGCTVAPGFEFSTLELAR